MKTYELMLIVNPTISESDRTSSIEEIKKIIENFSGKIKKEDVWGEKKMAYKLNNSDKGFYILFEIEIDGKELKTITKEINLNKNIWRHMFVAND
ncbi:MAG: 30S ribosomal protein S6 [Candidatus Gracilibacteria bacterium]|nr:30S ribosomal protein S6 [Candidatus Gracilibacteria bacterium]